MVTAYDYPSSVHVDHAGIDIALVGDSVAMVVHGQDTTLPVTLDDMLLHCKAASGVLGDRFWSVICPLAPMSKAPSSEDGRSSRVAAAKAISEAGIAVMGHVGLTPQAISVLGGFRPQGRNSARALLVLEHALAFQAAGCFALVLECLPSPVAAAITTALKIPTVGIGAGPLCSGQVLVYHDLLGMMQHPHYAKVTPKFCKKFANIGEIINSALEEYQREVTSEQDRAAHSPYRLENDQLEAFLVDLQKHGLHDAAEAASRASEQDLGRYSNSMFVQVQYLPNETRRQVY
ncbi:hypothetical protein R1flu_003758 [Riccia fluitans]|uniref:3-methyl-2-oxobutanoate hydroxymethyltransferase n=1 Tax=Riccia fluitans TaxID=41844 RepID=A0ABD1YA32_9MARC